MGCGSNISYLVEIGAPRLLSTIAIACRESKAGTLSCDNSSDADDFNKSAQHQFKLHNSTFTLPRATVGQLT